MEKVNVYPETADIETSSGDYARRFAGAVGAWFLEVQEQATLRMLAPYAGATVLDVGGGHGQTAPFLVREGFQLTILGSADICRQRIRHLVDEGRCDFQVGNILDLPYPDNAFDVVLTYRLLPHVTQWQPLIAELARVARRAVVLDYPEIRSINYIAPYLFRFKKSVEKNTRPYTCFREQDLLAQFARYGFVKGDSYPEFFLPMVLHRALKAPRFSALVEKVCRNLALTKYFGSPIVLKLVS